MTKIGKYAMALIETIFSAIIIALLYLIYLPFGIIRVPFDGKAFRNFYNSLFRAVDGITTRLRR